MKYFLLVDMGTGNTRVALTDSSGKILSLRTFSNIYYRDGSYPDAQYFIPEEWEEKILSCCDEIHAECPEIRASAITAAGARQSIVLVDKDGKSFFGLPNIDNRGREYMGEITEKEKIYRDSGKWVTEDFCAAKVYGYKKLYPDDYSKIDCMLSLNGWIGYLFSGAKTFEQSQACETQFYDIGQKEWSDFLCRQYGVDKELLPPLTPAGTVAGKIRPELIKRLGLCDDAVFVVGGADTQSALYQTRIQKGDVAIVSGTTSPVVALTEEKFYDPGQRVWTDANFGADGYVVETNTGVSGLNYQRAKSQLAPDISYDDLEKAYDAKNSFSCTASFTSLLFHEQRSLRKGGFFTGSPMSDAFDRVDMMWAVLADIACAIYEQLYRLKDLTGNTSSYVLGCGGGFRSKTLCQMISDLSGMELRLRPGFEQATVNGLAAICRCALSIKEDDDISDDIICYYPRKNQLIHSYHPIWNENRLKANKIQ